MIDILSLDPSNGVPDLLYEALHWEPATEDEARAGYVLRLHRDALNGGMHQALKNLFAIQEDAHPYVLAYKTMGLERGFALWSEALKLTEAETGSDEDWDILDEKFERLTFGEHSNEPDGVERVVMAVVLRSPAAYSNALTKAGIG